MSYVQQESWWVNFNLAFTWIWILIWKLEQIKHNENLNFEETSRWNSKFSVQIQVLVINGLFTFPFTELLPSIQPHNQSKGCAFLLLKLPKVFLFIYFFFWDKLCLTFSKWQFVQFLEKEGSSIMFLWPSHLVSIICTSWSMSLDETPGFLWILFWLNAMKFQFLVKIDSGYSSGCVMCLCRVFTTFFRVLMTLRKLFVQTLVISPNLILISLLCC